MFLCFVFISLFLCYSDHVKTATSVVAKVPAWLSGNALYSINVVTLRRARSVPGRVTVFGRVKHSGTESGT